MVFGVGSDSDLWVKRYNGQWSDWESLGGTWMGSPVPVTYDPQSVAAYLIAPDRSVWSNFFQDGSWRKKPLGGWFPNDTLTATNWGPSRVVSIPTRDTAFGRALIHLCLQQVGYLRGRKRRRSAAQGKYNQAPCRRRQSLTRYPHLSGFMGVGVTGSHWAEPSTAGPKPSRHNATVSMSSLRERTASCTRKASLARRGQIGSTCKSLSHFDPSFPQIKGLTNPLKWRNPSLRPRSCFPDSRPYRLVLRRYGQPIDALLLRRCQRQGSWAFHPLGETVSRLLQPLGSLSRTTVTH